MLQNNHSRIAGGKVYTNVASFSEYFAAAESRPSNQSLARGALQSLPKSAVAFAFRPQHMNNTTRASKFVTDSASRRIIMYSAVNSPLANTLPGQTEQNAP